MIHAERFDGFSVALGALAMMPVSARQSAPGTPSPQAVKAAADATRAAQQINLQAMNHSGLNGSVGLYVIGRSRTRIVVRLPNAGKYRVTLHPGSECTSSRTATLADVALTPTNFNTTGASMSSTIVSLPIEKIRSNYVVDVRSHPHRTSAPCG